MAKPAGLTKRDGSSNWYFRKRCPKHLKAPGVPSEVWIALRTSDFRLALTRLDQARADADEQFRAGNAGGISPYIRKLVRPDDPNFPILSVAEVAPLARAFFQRALLDLDARSENPPTDFSEAIEWQRELSDREARLRFPAEDDEHPALGAELDVLTKARRRSPYDSEASTLLRSYIRRAMLQLVALEKARLGGDFSLDISDPFFVPQGTTSTEAHRTRLVSTAEHSEVTVGDASRRYLDELFKTAIERKTRDRYEAEIGHIVNYLGASTEMSDVRRPECVALREAFALLPPNFGKQLKGRSVRDLLADRRDGDPVLAHATLSKYLDALSRFTRWAHREDLLLKDYGAELEPLEARPDGTMAKLPFEADELRRFFARPIYTGCRDDTYGFATVGSSIIRRSRYWAPLIALFGGLRAEEIFQLTPGHFRISDGGTPFIVLTRDMKLKNENAEREIPVHTALRGIGLLAWVERRRHSPTSRLFPELSVDAYGSHSSNFSKRFKSDLKHLQLGERRPKLTFHSFRHTFKRALDREDVSEQEKDELCGWARGKKIGRRYGIGLEADKLASCIELVAFDVDVSHLYNHSGMID